MGTFLVKGYLFGLKGTGSGVEGEQICARPSKETYFFSCYRNDLT